MKSYRVLGISILFAFAIGPVTSYADDLKALCESIEQDIGTTTVALRGQARDIQQIALKSSPKFVDLQAQALADRLPYSKLVKMAQDKKIRVPPNYKLVYDDSFYKMHCGPSEEEQIEAMEDPDNEKGRRRDRYSNTTGGDSCLNDPVCRVNAILYPGLDSSSRSKRALEE